MSSFQNNAMNIYETIAQRLQNFLYEGKSPKIKNRIEYTKEELYDELENIRLNMWEEYNNGQSELGWKE